MVTPELSDKRKNQLQRMIDAMTPCFEHVPVAMLQQEFDFNL